MSSTYAATTSRRHFVFARLAAALLPAVALVACSSDGYLAGADASTPDGGVVEVTSAHNPGQLLGVATQIAGRDADLVQRIAVNTDGWRLEGGSATSPGWRSALPDELGARLAPTADAPFTIAIGQSEVLRLTLKAEGARSVPLELDAGRAVFTGAYPSTDLLYGTDPRRVEAFYLLRDDRAPTSYTWRVERGQGIFSTEQAEDGSVLFYDDRHVAIFRIPPPVAIDAAGLKRAGTLEWTGERVRFSIDTKGMTFPVLLDPATVVVDWSLQSTTTVQSGALTGVAMAYDSVRTRTVLFGGYNAAFGNDNATYEWEGGTARFKPTNLTGTRPAIRSYHGMAYDTSRQVTVLFGGKDTVAKNDTWEWNGTAWAQKCSTTPCSSTLPAARERFAQVYDANAHKTFVFGGRNGATNYSDTWAWNGSAWSNACTGACASAAPAARWGAAAAYDASRHVTVVFGGTTTGTTGNAQTWEWSGTAWANKVSAHVPSSRWGAAMAYDPTRNVVVMFGGQTGAGSYVNDTWEWDGTDWTQRTPATVPPERSFAAAAVYQMNILVYGGTNASSPQLNDSWYYQWFGGTCTVNAQCPPAPGNATGYCVDNVCCSTACDGGTLGNCQACSIARGAASDGLCGAVSTGFPCEDGDLCTTGETCNAAQKCLGQQPVLCATADQCHVNPGACVPSSGLCFYNYVGDGTPKDGSNQPYTCTVSGAIGLCAVGNVLCASQATSCAQITFPAQVTETCNGIDDDCNGTVDDVAGAGVTCSVAGKLGPCAVSAQACINTSGTWSFGCPQTVFAVAETCNGVDDNCDGSIDNGILPGVGNACDIPGLQGVCAGSEELCDHGVLSCLQTNFPSLEVCNSLDDNCNGQIDEGLLNTVSHCGGCNMACSTNNISAHCTAPGTCDGTCNSGDLDCNADKRTDGCEIHGAIDPLNCGSCGGVCSTNNITATCAAGACNGTCATNFFDCNANKRTDGCERDGRTDITHCGGCTNVCSSSHIATVLCTAGVCNGACSTGWADCNNNKLLDGCEVNITGAAATDVLNCGGCNNVCSTQHITRACVGGSCGAGTCDVGFSDCNSDKLADGCEIQTSGADPNNCGACAAVCSANNVVATSCLVGVCNSRCIDGYADCNSNKLTDGCETNVSGPAATDVLNCGGCGTVCSTNNITRACAAGSCSAGVCSANFADCNSNKQTDGCEINLTNSVANCGSCGTDCSGLPHVTAASAACSASVCSFTCATGWGDCDGNKLNGCETNLNTSATNCGTCNAACSSNHATPSCNAGSCNSACAANYGDCNGNLRTDGCELQITGAGASSAANCGGCGLACSSSHITSPACTNGLCSTGCDTGYTDCNALDVNRAAHAGADGCEASTGTDANNCGGCGTVCSISNMATRTCAGGVCNGSCTSGYADCNSNKLTDGCEINLNGDVNNCSGCGLACSTSHMSPAQCGSGSCESGTCATGYFNCNSATYPTTSKRVDGCEVNGVTDSSNCGGCNNGCSTAHVATTVAGSDGVTHGQCSGSACSSACSAGYGDCNSNKLTDGCETDLTNTTANCGSCGNNCGALANTAGNSCAASACVIGACAGNWKNCNALTPDGCEIDTATNGSNCSGCGRVCSTVNMTGGGTCALSACSGTCNLGFADCNADKATGGGNGCESTLNTVTTCGSCAGVCTSGANKTAQACSYNSGTPASSYCTYTCGTGYFDCNAATATSNNADGCEVNGTIDANNCGGCGNVCSSSGMATRTCGSSLCNGTCTAGYFDCNSNKLTDGCEKNGITDTANCGGCGNVCSSSHVTTLVNGSDGVAHGSCGSSVCNSACVQTAGQEWNDCDANKLANGCESNFATTTSCGGCGVACTASVTTHASAVTSCTDSFATSASGSANYCNFTCSAGFANCDSTATMQATHNVNGCESDLTSTSTCGTCLGVCASADRASGWGCTYNSGTPASSYCTYTCDLDTSGNPSYFDCDRTTAVNQNANGCEVASPYYYLDCDGDGYGGGYAFVAGLANAGLATSYNGSVTLGTGGVYFACSAGALPSAVTACATRLGGTWAAARWQTTNTDCLDSNAAVNPGVLYDVCADGLDNDCAGGVDVPGAGHKFQTPDNGLTITTSGSSGAAAQAINWAGTKAVTYANQRLDGPVGADTTYGDVFKVTPTYQVITTNPATVSYTYQIYFTNNAGQVAPCANQSDFEMSVYSDASAATASDNQNNSGWGGGYTPGAGTAAPSVISPYIKSVACTGRNTSGASWFAMVGMQTVLSYYGACDTAGGVAGYAGPCTNQLSTTYFAASNTSNVGNTFYVRVRRRPAVTTSCNTYSIYMGML